MGKNTENNNTKVDSANSTKRPLRYQQELDKVPDVVSEHYKAVDTHVFRTVISIPPTEVDSTPQKYRRKEGEGGKITPPKEVTKEELDAKSIAKRKKFVTEQALSVNQTEEQCQKAVRKSYENVKNSYGLEEAEEYIKNSRGKYMVRLHITEDAGLLGEFDANGHANLLLYEDVRIEDLIDKGYEPKIVKYK